MLWKGADAELGGGANDRDFGMPCELEFRIADDELTRRAKRKSERAMLMGIVPTQTGKRYES